ncbi:MAG TPA: DUF4159 domain-containing protein [Vicinamibacterales bacterium]|nr:DUF4159 domain-containing protein [Vicinamibacterales bacterium]
MPLLMFFSKARTFRWVRAGTAAVAALVVLGGAVRAAAQRSIFRSRQRNPTIRNVPYNGQFTFVRVNYTHWDGGDWYLGLPAWAHGYPLAEQNLMRIMNEVSYLGARSEEINSLALDDPALMKYPVAYIIEVGWWQMRENEATALREYIQKGGFVIVDDFKVRGGGFPAGGGWENFEDNMRQVFHDVRFYEMELSHPIFHSFFDIKSLDVPQAYNAGRAIFRGVYEDNDPTKRLQMIINYNTDISQFWEWSGTGLRPVDDTNEAYKLGVNYIMYGLTH